MQFIQSARHRLRRFFLRQPQAGAVAVTRSPAERYLLASAKFILLVAAAICIVIYHVLASLMRGIFGGLIESLFEW